MPPSFALQALEGAPQAQTGSEEHFSFAVRQLLAQHWPFVFTLVSSSVTFTELGCFRNIFGNIHNKENSCTLPSCLRVIEGLPSKKKSLRQLRMKHSVIWLKFNLRVHTHFKFITATIKTRSCWKTFTEWHFLFSFTPFRLLTHLKNQSKECLVLLFFFTVSEHFSWNNPYFYSLHNIKNIAVISDNCSNFWWSRI